MKLALGTVQFGLDYGAFNRAGQVGPGEVAAILETATAAGIDTLDSARAYGESEEVLGRHQATQRFHVVTKVKALAGEADLGVAIKQSIADSRAALNAARLDTLLFHSAGDLLGEHGDLAWQAAEAAQARGEVRRLGVSVYSHEEALAAADRFPITVVQIPVNLFDQRAILSGAVEQLAGRNIEVHARSVFLQGFALADPDGLSSTLARYRSELLRFRDFCTSHGATPLQAALGFVLAQQSIHRVVVGVQSTAELDEILAAAASRPNLTDACRIACSDPTLINPANW